MKAKVGAEIRVIDPTYKLWQWAQKKLVVDNPQYEKLQALGKSTYKTQRKLYLYRKVGTDIYLPFGCLRDIFEMKADFEWIENCIHPLQKRDFHSHIRLYDYQETAVTAALKAKNGVLVAPCGSGKTQMALELAARIGGRTLWLTHTHDLLKQSRERAAANFDLPPSAYGEISGGKVNIGDVITFATVQTMAGLDLAKYQDCFDCIICDECHHCAGTPAKITMFYKVLSSLSARYKYGITATPDRADGLSCCMFAILGNVCARVSSEAVTDKTVPVKVVWTSTSYSPKLIEVCDGDGTLSYTRLVNAVCADADRNTILLKKIIEAGKSTLVLSDRVAHCEALCKAAQKEGLRCVYISAAGTKTAKAEREKAIDDLDSGRIDVAFATYQLAKEGLDCPHLLHLVLATPQKEKNTVTQAVGRVTRSAEGKSFGTVYDFSDDFGYFYGAERKRKAIYKKLGSV